MKVMHRQKVYLICQPKNRKPNAFSSFAHPARDTHMDESVTHVTSTRTIG